MTTEATARYMLDTNIVRHFIIVTLHIVMVCYGLLRADLQKRGKILGNLNLLIAAHA